MEISQMKSGIEALAPWFHRVELPHGLSTKEKSHFGEDADHPIPTWNHVKAAFPARLDGKTVLDVGCNAGFYSFAALERGAASVVGVDAVRWQVQQARFAAQAKGITNAQFQRASLYELDPKKHGTFDVVLALGLLYHLKHLILGIERLFSVTNELLIVESAVIDGARDFGCEKTEPIVRANDEVYLVGYPKNSPWVSESAFNWFFPTAAALRAMIEDVGFVDVQIVDVFFNRCLITARKPSHLIDSRYPAFLRATIEPEQESYDWKAGESAEVRLSVTNSGRALWRTRENAPEKGAVRMIGKIYSEDDPVFGVDVTPIDLPQDLHSGGSWTPTVSFAAPLKPGRYTLELDLQSAKVANFQDVGSSPLEVSFVVSD